MARIYVFPCFSNGNRETTSALHDLEMILTGKHLEVISGRPLNDLPDPFREKLQHSSDTADTLEGFGNLLGALVASPAALRVPSPHGNGNVGVRLFSVQQHVRGGSVKPDHFRTLIRCVVDKSTDTDIWAAVFTILENLGAITPPSTSIAPKFQGTSTKTTSSRVDDSETRGIVEEALFFEI